MSLSIYTVEAGCRFSNFLTMFGKVLDAASAAYRVAKRALSHERTMQGVRG